MGECLSKGILRPGDQRSTTFQVWALVHGMAKLIIERHSPLHLGITAAHAAGVARAALDAQLSGLAAGRRRPT